MTIKLRKCWPVPGMLSLLAAINILTGCTGSSTSNCTAGSTDSACQVTNTIGSDPSLFLVSFIDSSYFDANLNNWQTIPASDPNSGTINTTIPVYDSYVNMSLTDAINSALLATSEKSSSAAVTNPVPYLEFKVNSAVQYIFRYQKYDSSGTQLVDYTGSILPSNGRAILPLVNAQFNNQYYDSTATLGTRYKNVISITAENNQKAGAVYQVVFQSVYAIQNISTQTVYSSAMANFSLANRWSFFNNATNTGGNQNLPFVTFKSTQNQATTGSLDTQVVFYAPPQLQIVEELFFEMPFQGDSFKLTGVVVPDRGNSFVVQTISLDSQNDFNMVLSLGNVSLSPLADGVTFQALNTPVGTSLDLTLGYNLTNNSKYGAPPNKSGDSYSNGLLFPLKPVCYEEKGQTYQPWATINQSYAVACDLDTTTPLATAASTSIDTWHGFFSYAPYRPDKNELGHMFGIKSIHFVYSGYYKIQAKAPSDTVWQTATNGGVNPTCTKTTNANCDTTWTYVSVEKAFSIFDNMGTYSSFLNLNSILSRFQSSSVQPYSYMHFNNEDLLGNTVRHIY